MFDYRKYAFIHSHTLKFQTLKNINKMIIFQMYKKNMTKAGADWTRDSNDYLRLGAEVTWIRSF